MKKLWKIVAVSAIAMFCVSPLAANGIKVPCQLILTEPVRSKIVANVVADVYKKFHPERRVTVVWVAPGLHQVHVCQ